MRIENQGFKNYLVNEKSPYLLQHAKNPVNWYPWGDKAFKKAEKENKPIFLSIGYSTCHWCHVMAHESFEDEEIANLMNDAFISIKVDREERPDIDKIYMTVCQMMTGSGGWPLTIIMTPDKKPFFAGTYFPKNTRFGRIGLKDLILRIKELWENQRNQILIEADKITFTLQNATNESHGEKLNENILKKTFNKLRSRFDEKNGGFGGAPKFPTPHNLLFLLRYWKRVGEQDALDMVEKTLDAMRRGGIYDHIGFGFHRYSTDSNWIVPHFEKMLYDNALLAMAYIEAYQATKNEKYAKTAKDIFEYILTEMTSSEGGFFSAEDADSEGEEGKFYVWSYEELALILNIEEFKLAKKLFSLKESGNYKEEATRHETNANILYLNKTINEFCLELDIPKEELVNKIEIIRKKLFKARKKRIRPSKDDKILTDWNGLMIAAFAKAAQVFNEEIYLKSAENAINFILNNMQKEDGRLLHRYRNGSAEIDGYIDDYSFLIWALIELFEATFKVFYLEKALELNKYSINHFWDEHIGGFFFSSDHGEKLLTRQKEIYDGAIPSGNSVAMLNLLRLASITGNTEFEEKAEIIGRVFAETVKKSPSAFTQLMIAINFGVGPSYSLVIAGDRDADDTNNMRKAIRKHYLPNKSLILRDTEQKEPKIDSYSNFIQYFEKLNNKATAYVCINKTCKPPTNNPGKLLELLESKWENIREN